MQPVASHSVLDFLPFSLFFFLLSLSSSINSLTMAQIAVVVPTCSKDSVPEAPKNAAMACAVCGSRKHMTSKLFPTVRINALDSRH